jgi:cathepsin L
VATFEKMLKCFIIFFFLNCIPVRSLNASDCYGSGHMLDICEYMNTFSKKYANHTEIKLRAERIDIAKQRGKNNKVFGKTSRSDLFPHEKLQNKHLTHSLHEVIRRKEKNRHVHLGAPRALPPIDWRNVDGVSYVTPVLNQGACGACYAFAAATTLEYWSMKSEPVQLSVEHLLDCSSMTPSMNDGCEGGLMEHVFEYAMSHSVVLERDGPFAWGIDACPNREMYSRVSVLNWKVIEAHIDKNAEKELEWILHAYGPVTIGVDSRNWDDYVGGTFTHDLCDTEIDHAVTIVGYTPNTWIVKNSWGTDWGVDGYIYLERGHNTCGLSEYIVYVTDAVPISEYRPSTFL